MPEPIYTAENCQLHYELKWSFTLFWKTAPGTANWLSELSALTEADGVRVLEHRFARPDCSQFLVSTLPHVAASVVPWSIKGRLQKLIRHQWPSAFQRNYNLHSIGSTKREKLECYVASQVQHHLSAESPLRDVFSDLQIVNPDVDLSAPRFTAHARYWANFHIVLVHDWRRADTRPEAWIQIRNMIRRASDSKRHLLSRAGFVPDHLHLTLGIHPQESPIDVSLSYMNNLAWAQGQRPVFMQSFYVATFGEYDLGVLPHPPATGPAPVV
jgi:REP element-mobilizing transposase RayT